MQISEGSAIIQWRERFLVYTVAGREEYTMACTNMWLVFKKNSCPPFVVVPVIFLNKKKKMCDKFSIFWKSLC